MKKGSLTYASSQGRRGKAPVPGENIVGHQSVSRTEIMIGK
ncbi:hypothetical protein [Candidatus Williamhamiltonella defendens]|nr:hypothetical protein [Candidatus Hamiltonella defensa]